MSIGVVQRSSSRVWRVNRRHGVANVAAELLEGRALFATIVVNTVIDGIFPPGSGFTSLRDAIERANAGADATTITFDAAVFERRQTIALNGTPLTLAAGSTTIVGPAAGVVIDANLRSGVFQVLGGVGTNLSGLILTRGSADVGGGLLIGADVTLRDVTVMDCRAATAGGGIFSNAGNVVLERVTVMRNTAPFGGGVQADIFNDVTRLKMTNVTVAGNTATNTGGGLVVGSGSVGRSSAELRNVTISNNTARNSAGIYNGGTTTVTNSIIAGNRLSSAAGAGPDVTGTFNSLSGNLIGKTDDSTGWIILDQTGTQARPLDPRLGILDKNGGPTLTMEPLPGSPAIDRGFNALAPNTDQRGRSRPVNATVDVGAVEVQPTAMAARHTFYNNSSLDGNVADPTAADDAAIAAGKAPVLPGAGSGSFANVTSYLKGLNGVFVDVADPPEGVPLTADDFEFRSGRAADPDGLGDGPAPLSVSVRRGEGVGGSDRFTIVWKDYDRADTSGLPQAVANGWLWVKVKANERTGLPGDDVFAFGNIPGDATGDLRVNALDLSAVKRALNSTSGPAGVVDFNRDGRVNALDLAAVRGNLNRTLPVLTIAVPAAAPTEGVRRRVWDDPTAVRDAQASE